MKLYNVRKFLKNVKEALDAAQADEEVYILRDDIVYKVCKANNQSPDKFIEEGIISKNPRPISGEKSVV